MSVPSEYTDAYNNLVAFRTKLLTDLVKERVIASLNAEHEGMIKYSSLVNGLSITPYLIGKMRESALALRIGSKDLGEGTDKTIKAKYTGIRSLYPMTPPYSVPQRLLPQVDVYTFTPSTTVDLKELSDMATSMGMFVIQSGSGAFLEPPDAENALYDYYNYYPLLQMKGSLELPTPNACNIKYVRGVYNQLWRRLHRSSDGQEKSCSIEAFIDCEVEYYTGDIEPYPAIMRVMMLTGEPYVTTILVGKRIHQAFNGTYSVRVLESRDIGVIYCSPNIVEVVDEQLVWYNNFTLTRTVNNASMGYIDPPSGEYTIRANGSIDTEAFSVGGYNFDHWELDGVNVSTDNPIDDDILKPCELKAVFV